MSLPLGSVKQLLINTGNILSLNDITKNPGQNPSEELIEAINLTIKDYQGDENALKDPKEVLLINRANDDFPSKRSEQDISDLKISLKIFLTTNKTDFLNEALDKVFDALNINSIQNVIISYKTPTEKSHDDVEEIKGLWKVLEECVKNEKVQQIGIADVEESVFRKIYEWSSVKPTIIQINLATCCVVPPTLQAFCKEHDIQLLTHSDPIELLPKSSIEGILGKPFSLSWASRYSVHIKCRGVLITKGYLISVHK